MEPILPSELARLVLGYLEHENCQEAAKVFFDTSPDLSEYRKLAKLGKPFGKKVYGLTLNNIVENLVSASMLLQEKLSQISDSGSSDNISILKQSNNLMEQLKFILDEKFQRFYVNISVPTPNTSTQTTSGSPIISSSIRKRKTSVTNERKDKRQQKLNILTNDQDQVNNTETTTLNQLPGHSKNLQSSPRKQEVNVQEQFEFEVPQIIEQPKQITINDNITNQVIPTSSASLKIGTQSVTCSTGTGTDELKQFTTTEVQTNAIDNLSCDDPIRNLSLISSALLNRTELHEKIAENINNENRDLSSHEVTSDCNASMTAQLNAYIESIVSKTEKDPIFEQFINDFIRPDTDDTEPETEMSPDEEDPIDVINLPNNKSTSPIIFHDQQDIELLDLPDNIDTNELNKKENNLPINNDNCYKNNEEIKSLDDMNAAAIMGIMSVNALNEKIIEENKPIKEEKQEIKKEKNKDNLQITDNVISTEIIKPVDKLEKKKKPRKAKLPKREIKPTVEMDVVGIMEVPTLIRCSDDENVQTQNNLKSLLVPSGPNKLVFIAPKTCNDEPPKRPIFLKTVNLKFPINKTDDQCVNSTATSLQSVQQIVQPVQQIIQPVQQIIQPIQQTIQPVQQIIQPVSEIFPSIQQQIIPSIQQQIIPSIQQQIIPSIQQTIQSSPLVPENSKNSTEGFSLSPYLKFDRPPQDPSCVSQFEMSNNTNNDNEASTSMIHSDSIIKRTPKTLLKSRANNHRLSLSTPRKRISHIRALDFNTPTKGIKNNRRMSDANNGQRLTGKKLVSKTNSRASLFKSPHKTLLIKKIKTPKRLNTSINHINHNNSNNSNDDDNNNSRVPIATRGPEPKLNGGWDKYTGVGMIIDGLSQSSSSPEKKPPPTNKTWDADLRGKINIITTDKKPVVRKKRIFKNKREKTDKLNNIESEDIQIENDSNDSNDSDASKPVDTINTSIEKNVKLNNQNIKSITKKYATLKTLTTSVTKKEINKSLNTTTDLDNKGRGAFSKVNPGFIQNLSELETPRKFDNSNGIPPTPKITSPHSNQTMFSQLNDDSGKIQTFPPTPEFPPTPNIVITPRQSSDITIDTTKDCQFVGCSTYYQPSCELSDDKLVKIKNDNITFEKISSSSTITTTTTKISGITDVTSIYKKDVTQYEVVKGHLPREDKSTELKMSSNDTNKINKNNSIIHNKETSNINSNNDSKSHCKSYETSGTADDSSDSDSGSSSSSSSSSSGSSSYSSMNDTNTSSRVSSVKKIKKSTNNKDKFKELFGDQESDISGIAKDSPIVTDTNKCNIDNNKNTKEENESSPTKVFSIVKTDDMLKDVDLETPAKDETILNEEDIGVTPNSSKPGVKNMTNLSTTIAATNNTNNMSPPSIIINKNQSKVIKIIKPTIISVKKITPENAVQLKPISQYLNDIPTIQSSIITRDVAVDAKLSAELHEKKLRVINKLNAGTTKQPQKKVTKKNTLPLNNDNKIQQQQQQQQNDNNNIKKLQEPFAVNKIEKKTRLSRVPAKQVVQKKVDDTTASTDDKIIDQPSSLIVKPGPASIGLRKSARNAEKIAAKRGVSEPRERSGNAKKQLDERKAQSSRETNVNDDIIIDSDILTTKNISQEIIKPVDDTNKQDEIKEDKKLTVDSIKEPVKSKVDMVKRDLFSDDEQQNDKITTRSKTQKYDNTEINTASDEKIDVLECLELVPTKNIDEFDASTEAGYQHIEVSFVFDENTVIPKDKKRKRKYSNSELECRIQIDNCGEDEWKLLTAPPCEEIFAMMPEKKKAPRKRPVKTTVAAKIIKEKSVPAVVRKRAVPVKLRNSKSSVSVIESQPLATSSPVENTTPRTIDKQVVVVAAAAVGADEQKIETTKTKKRKVTDTQNNNQTENKKPRVSVPNAEDLLKKLDVGQLLDCVHGPGN